MNSYIFNVKSLEISNTKDIAGTAKSFYKIIRITDTKGSVFELAVYADSTDNLSIKEVL
jgi:hypothetical protein